MNKKKEMMDFSVSTFFLKHKINELIGKQYDLPAIEVEILAFLYYNGEKATASAIERERKIKKNTISIHVESLVRSGYLVRSEIENDRRSISLALTEKSTKIAQEVAKQNELLRQKLLEGLTKDEIKTMYRCFEIIHQNAAKLLKK